MAFQGTPNTPPDRRLVSSVWGSPVELDSASAKRHVQCNPFFVGHIWEAEGTVEGGHCLRPIPTSAKLGDTTQDPVIG